MTLDERQPTREEVKRYMAERKAGRADSKPFIGKWTGNYGRNIASCAASAPCHSLTIVRAPFIVPTLGEQEIK